MTPDIKIPFKKTFPFTEVPPGQNGGELMIPGAQQLSVAKVM